MKVLIVSFDKTLTEDIKNALGDHEVFTAKNSEDALKMSPPDVDVIIYDAISGAISEEDINMLYSKKFSNAKFVILYDELFPIDENNIQPPNKVLIKRDESPQKIARIALEGKVEEVKEERKEEELIESTYLDKGAVRESEAEKREETKEEEKKARVSPVSGGKLLIVSFDQTIVDTIKTIAGDRFEIETVRTVKQALEKGKEADIIVFDAISGVIAEKGLTDMSKDEELAKKPYIILIDDLFPINVNGIPLENKFSVSRDAEPSKIEEVLEKAIAVITPKEEVKEEKEEKVESAVEEKTEHVQTEEVKEEVVEEKTEEAAGVEEREEAVQEIEEIPALSALEKIIEGEKEEEKKEEEKEEALEEEAPAEELIKEPSVDLSINVEEAIKEAVLSAFSEERIRSIISSVMEEKLKNISDEIAGIVNKSVNETLSSLISQKVEEEVRKAIQEVDVKGIIKEVAYQILKEKINELVS